MRLANGPALANASILSDDSKRQVMEARSNSCNPGSELVTRCEGQHWHLSVFALKIILIRFRLQG